MIEDNYPLNIIYTGKPLHKNFTYLLPSQHYPSTDPTDYTDEEVMLQMGLTTFHQLERDLSHYHEIKSLTEADDYANKLLTQLLAYLELKK